ncbi:T9SS type A sorting domain-containing protein [candidate division WOR-3 bacterium]|nr:T9SS type A sorting domain-containing protein [candidate division WOR-3 bacterium]
MDFRRVYLVYLLMVMPVYGESYHRVPIYINKIPFLNPSVEVKKNDEINKGKNTDFGNVSYGKVDTVGTTTYDLQWCCGPSLRRIIYDPQTGYIHVYWMWSDEESPFHDRNMYYNLYIPGQGWRWQEGTPIFSVRCGWGAFDIDTSGIAIATFHRTDTHRSVLVILDLDVSPFPSYNLPTSCIRPVPSIDGENNIIVTGRYEEGEEAMHISYFRFGVDTEWQFIDYGRTLNSFASKSSERHTILWTKDFAEYSKWYLYNSHLLYITSEDGGYGWEDTCDINDLIPETEDNWFEWYEMGSIMFGGHGIFDRNNIPHITFETSMATRTGPGYFHRYLQTVIYHYSPYTGLSPVTVYPTPDTLCSYESGCGYLARNPSIGEDPQTGYLYCVWLEFPPDEMDGSSGFLVGDIYVSRSMDDGVTWGPKVNLTRTCNSCEVYPSLAPVVNDTLHIFYEQDIISGCYVMYESPCSYNPMVYHRVPVIPGDIEVVSIDSPPLWDDSTMFTGETYTPKVIFRNNSNGTLSFQARFDITTESFYEPLNDDVDTLQLILGLYYDVVDIEDVEPGEFVEVYFSPFLCDTTLVDEDFKALVHCKASACFLGDIDISNNIIIDSCIVDSMPPAPGIENNDRGYAEKFWLGNLTPNPFSFITKVPYTASGEEKGSFSIYDISGRLVKKFQLKPLYNKSTNYIIWNGTDETGKELGSGLYFLKFNGKKLSRKIIYIKGN